MSEHVILVAFTVKAESREAAHKALLPTLPRPFGNVIENWWVAEDDRCDGSDNDSAVFVTPGMQSEASATLYELEYTPAWNVVLRPNSRFEG